MTKQNFVMNSTKNKNFKALLLAAGFGTRLGELTKKVPKCLMLIGDKPLLGLWIEKLENLGCDEIIINLTTLQIRFKCI